MEYSNFEKAIEAIGFAVFEMIPVEDTDNTEIRKAVNSLLDATNEGYLLITWPESQEYMEEDWFDEEAILALGSEDKTGSSAYFIPIKRVL